MVIRKHTPNARSPSRTEEISAYKRQKAAEINACLEKRNVDLWQLRELALTRGGLINGELRGKAWHKLAGINPSFLHDSSMNQKYQSDVDSIETDEMELIRRDVGRSVFFRWQQSKGSGAKLEVLPQFSDCEVDAVTSANRSLQWEQQNMLASAIVSAIAPRRSDASDGIIIVDEDERLHYYQGFHDIASVILLNISDKPEVASSILQKIASGPLRDATRENFSLLMDLLDMVFFPLVQTFDEEVHDFLMHCGCSTDFFLSWIITWFAHDIHHGETASRLFDAFLASHPLMPVYLAAAIVVHPISRKRLFATECDPGMIQMALADILRGISSDFAHEAGSGDTITFQILIDDAISFMRKVPPCSILLLNKRYRRKMTPLSSSISMLKTPSWVEASTASADWVQWQQHRSRGGCRRKIGKACSSVATSYLSVSPVNSILKSPSSKHNTHVRAKVASGVSSLMDSNYDYNSSAFNNSTSATAAVKSMADMFGKVVLEVKNLSTQKRLEWA